MTKHTENSIVDVADVLQNKVVTPSPPVQRQCSKRKLIGGMVITKGEGKFKYEHLHTHCICKTK